MKNRIVKIWKLQATCQKSFYRKAYVFQDERGNLYLESYDTIVCGIIGGVFKKFWYGYSKTTKNHVNDFRKTNNMDTLSKKDWESLSVEADTVLYCDHVSANMGNQYYGIPFACR